jgi:vancomycin resistance protein VanJ
MLEIRCRCGETYRADPAHAGRRIRCRCGRTLDVQPPRARRMPAAATARARIGAVVDAAERRIRGALDGRTGRGGRAAGGARTWRRYAAGARHAALWGRWVGWAVLAYALLVAAALVVVWGMGDRWWLGTVALFGPRWLILLPLAALIPAAAVLRPRAMLPLGAAAMVALGPVMGFRIGWQGWLAGGGASLAVATFNADNDVAAAARLADLLERHDVAFAGIQECSPHTASILEMNGTWRVLREGSLCLATRYPAEIVDRFRVGAFERVRDAGIGGTSEAVRFRVHLPRGAVDVVNLHLETPRKGLEGLLLASDVDGVEANRMMREIESRRAFEWVAAGGIDSLIVLGDFNMPVESPIYRADWGAFDNAFSRAGWGRGTTKDNGWFSVRIDHVLTGRHWRARRARVGPDLGSDHWPVLVELRARG